MCLWADRWPGYEMTPRFVQCYMFPPWYSQQNYLESYLPLWVNYPGLTDDYVGELHRIYEYLIEYSFGGAM